MQDHQKRTVILAKEGEKYLFAYDERSRKALLGVFGRFAANPDLNFSWHDAAVLSKKTLEQEKSDQSRRASVLPIALLFGRGGFNMLPNHEEDRDGEK